MPRKRLTTVGISLSTPKFEEIVEEFLIFKENQGKAETTIKDYKFHIERFHRCYPYFPDVKQLKSSASEYLKEKISPSTYNLRLTYNKAFYRYCVDNGYLNSNPMKDFTVKKTEPRIVQNSPEVLSELLKQPDMKTYTGLRDYAMMVLTLDTGIRPSELRQLLPEDFNASQRHDSY